jgi:hypothetical protein
MKCNFDQIFLYFRKVSYIMWIKIKIAVQEQQQIYVYIYIYMHINKTPL